MKSNGSKAPSRRFFCLHERHEEFVSSKNASLDTLSSTSTTTTTLGDLEEGTIVFSKKLQSYYYYWLKKLLVFCFCASLRKVIVFVLLIASNFGKGVFEEGCTRLISFCVAGWA
eukprot:scaffold9646_cov133-Cylindrotheca_fusiformis.AAC.3